MSEKSNRFALLIGNNRYDDERLDDLRAPQNDIDDLGRVLADPNIGGFEVEKLHNPALQAARRTIADFFAQRDRHALSLLYFSGHGVASTHDGQLYLAFKETQVTAPDVDGLSAAFITRQLDKHQLSRVILIFDCCYSGAFERGTKSEGTLDLGAIFNSGYGRVVLTASRANERAWDGGQMQDAHEQPIKHSLFTHYLIQGLESGLGGHHTEATITIDALYTYASQAVERTSKAIPQHPRKWVGEQEGAPLIIAYNPRPAPTIGPLPGTRDRYFISYAPTDGERHAERLYDALTNRGVPVWLDRRDVREAGPPRDAQVESALKGAKGVLLVVTPDASPSDCDCAREWRRALQYKKPIVPVRCTAQADVPFYLSNRRAIDATGATGEFDAAVARLSEHLRWLETDAGRLQTLKDRRADAARDLRDLQDAQQKARARKEIAQLDREIAALARQVAEPQAVARETEQRIQSGLEREKQPARPVVGRQSTRFINPPPADVPDYFQDRTVELGLLGDFLHEDACRVISVVGRAGVGKTAMVCKLLKALERGRLPDLGGADAGAPFPVRGIVYLSAVGTRRVSVPTLYEDLSKLLEAAVAEELNARYRDPHTSTAEKFRALLAHFPARRPHREDAPPTVVLLDNFEDVVDPATHAITDDELDEALRAILDTPGHTVKVILTTRIAPRDLLLHRHERHRRIELHKGLPSPHAEAVLRAMDADGTVGLRDAPDALLTTARERTRGYPRALEALYAILSADRFTTVAEIVGDTVTVGAKHSPNPVVGAKHSEASSTGFQGSIYDDRSSSQKGPRRNASPLPDYVVQKLVGEAYTRLDTTAQRVMQALAIYDRPVTPAAVDYLLQPHVAGVDSVSVLNRLVTMHFARRERGRYYLHPVDRAYALAQIPADSLPPDSGEGPGMGVGEVAWTQPALYHRAADYYRQARLPRDEWHTIEDLAPQLAEFDLRCAAGEYDAAARVLRSIDFDYLLLWGHYHEMIRRHTRLQGKLDDPTLQRISAGNLGTTYISIDNARRAIYYYKQALAAAREQEDRWGEGVWLGNLGLAYADLGQTQRAIKVYEQALAIARDIGAQREEGYNLSRLGSCYADWGQTRRAIEFYEQAFTIEHEIGDRRGEGIDLGNRGNRYAELGETQRAIEFYQQALAIHRKISDRRSEGINLGNLAHVLIDAKRHEEAVTQAQKSVKIGEEISSPMICNAINAYLALAHLYVGNLKSARTAAEAACTYDVPQHNAYAHALRGLIALRQGDKAAARAAFTEAVAAADALLEHTPELYEALDAKGIALCGLALCGEPGAASAAADAFRQAREITAAPGIVARVRRLFEAMAIVDEAGVLA